MKMILTLLIAIIANTAIAAPQKAITVITNLSYQTVDNHYLPTLNEVQTYFNLNPQPNSPEWVEIVRMKGTSNPSDFIVLSQLAKSTSNEATINFLILDYVNDKSTIVSPTITVNYGEKKSIELKNNHHTIHLSVLAKK